MIGQLKNKETTGLATNNNSTPMMRQYLEIKADYQDAVLFFRLGDFYEMFYEDAEIAARELDLTLTGRGKKETEKRMPMCGIPYHAADNYILRLLNKGYKIAICEQVEDPALAKGLTKREVIKVITPGTLTDEKLLQAASSNYLLAVIKSDLKEDLYGLAFVEVSTGEFKLTQIYGRANLKNEILRIEPSEIIYNEECLEVIGEFIQVTSTKITAVGYETAKKNILAKLTLDNSQNSQLPEYESGVSAAAAILQYLEHTQKSELGQLNHLEIYLPFQYMYLDAASRRNLELTQTIRNQNRAGSLYWLLDKTKTAMGSRLLKEWLNYPLLDQAKIEARWAAIEELSLDLVSREELIVFLKDVYDIERLSGRIANGNANARDLVFLKESLLIINTILPVLDNFTSPLLAGLKQPALQETIRSVCKIIDESITPNPPLQLKEGNIIKEGYSEELDQIKKLVTSGKDWVARLEASEREKSGIKSLKVGYNSVFGYYLEVSRANQALVPEYYIRKQTLTNAERYITPELKEKESDILNAGAKLEKLEYQIFIEIRAKVAAYIKPIQKIAKTVAELDTLLSLAVCAVNNKFVKPRILNSGKEIIKIKEGRHPVIETAMSREEFIPNDLNFDGKDQQVLLLFGPNMSGKSTYMRQNALIVIMAQMGSFVPAAAMEFDLIDRLFTRVGAMDDLFAGQSTFMVEMSETANILKNATKNSLIILDEVGRGTSTYDGMSLAWALTEYIYFKIGAKTLFATHYHELSQLEAQYKGIRNYNVAVSEEGDNITFLHKVVHGPANGSYGVHVAQIAGLPAEVIGRARQILSGLENPAIKTDPRQQLGLF